MSLNSSPYRTVCMFIGMNYRLTEVLVEALPFQVSIKSKQTSWGDRPLTFIKEDDQLAQDQLARLSSSNILA